MKVLVTGANGFLAGYLVPQLLARGLSVVGLDDDSKYGSRELRSDAGYQHVTGSASNSDVIGQLAEDADYIVANAACVGGIDYLGAHDGEVGLSNSLCTSHTLRGAIAAHRRSGRLLRYVAVSSSMVFDQAGRWPTEEGHELSIAPPRLTYGMEKRAMESYVRAAGSQFDLPWTVVRPFNCVGIGETRAVDALERQSGPVSLVMSHVVPDLVHKVLLGQLPLHILGSGEQRRHFTAAADVARGLIAAMLAPEAENEDFNLAVPESHSIKEVAGMIWDRMRPDSPLRLVSDAPLPGDVEQRAPATEKAERLLGFRATIPLGEVLDETIAWVRTAFEQGRL